MGWKVVQQSSGVPIPPGEPVVWCGVPNGSFFYDTKRKVYAFRWCGEARAVDASWGPVANLRCHIVAPKDWGFRIEIVDGSSIFVPINDTRKTVFAKDCEPGALYQRDNGDWVQYCGEGDMTFFFVESGKYYCIADKEPLHIPQGVVTLEYQSGE